MIRGVSGVVLAGGKGERFGSNKALAPWRGGKLIEPGVKACASLFSTVFLITKQVCDFSFLRDCFVVEDLFLEYHPLGGIFTGLLFSDTKHIFVCACDMPFPQEKLIRAMCDARGNHDAVVPVWQGIKQPLFAVYSKNCLEKMKEMILAREFKMQGLFEGLNTLYLDETETRKFDETGLSFVDIDTPQDYEKEKMA